MSKRIHVTIPDYVYEGLERRADKQGRPIASLASFILEVALLEAQKRGELSPDPEKPKRGGA
ncbi:hypothetical protein IQ249_18745 [Lusitaniella coriacea LEGE 07157]|uniref:CopG-like ribbon-helix-helix domain-containing protein n=1 Tax=Lusitaniella coriacea LEGE 07157 TaxID=945747 RepID=A0A8J7JCW9_9CYAN|nr:hypothetical protein [Lusitaniella coriacea]MBE9117940.1 hypothetical protein [Lusitaniella coriacea LEGE 07157]